MPTLAAGQSVTLTLTDNNVVSLASNFGSASISVVANAGPTYAESWGPTPYRKTHGPFKEGATVTITSTNAEVLYDGGSYPVEWGSQIPPLVSKGGIWGSGARRSSFIVKPDGGAINATATPNTATEMCVFSSPVPFYAVRLHVQHWGGAGAIGAMTGFKALIGASDEIGTLDFTDVTNANFKKCVTPRSGGTAYTATVTDGTPGWKAVTWSGASSVNIADPGAGAVGWASSDVIYERGMLDSTWNVYPLLIRYYFGSAGYTYVSNLTGQQTGLNLATDFPSRPLVHLSRSGGDYVTTPASWTAGNTPTSTSSGANLFIEFFTASGVISVQLCGDSRMAVSAELSASKAYASTELYLHNAIKAAGYSPAIIRTGISGAGAAAKDNQTTANANYFVNGVGVQALPQPAGWLVYQTYTVNDGSLTDGLMTLLLARAADIAARARSSGQQVLMVGAWPKDGGFTGAELTRIATIKTAATALSDAVLDPIAVYGTATGDWSLYRYDTSHMTDAGYRDFASRIAAVVCA